MQLQEQSAQERVIEKGNTLVKLENTTQMSIAIQQPRNELTILQSALKELETYPSMAEEAIYSKPVGKDDSGKMKHAEGLSIRTAESLANRWKNSAYGGDIVSEDEESATIAAVFLDYENNTRHVVQKRVSKFYKQKGKNSIVQYTPDRFDIVLAANMSKILREVILRSLPGGLKKEYEHRAKQMLKGDKLQNRRTAIVAKFADLQVGQADIERYKGKAMKEWTHEDITELLGVYNAIRDGELSTQEILGANPKSQESGQSELPGLKLQTESEKIKCPNLDNTLVNVNACEKCSSKKGCPAWEKV
jgi:hypothetical protein